MNILNDKTDQNHVVVNQMEHVEQEKMEYKLIDTFLRTPGLKLWFYNPETEVIAEVIEKEVEKGAAQMVITEEKGFTIFDYKHKSINVNPRNIYFEALNWKSAERRVMKWEYSKIKELCNLRRSNNNNPIKLW